MYPTVVKSVTLIPLTRSDVTLFTGEVKGRDGMGREGKGKGKLGVFVEFPPLCSDRTPLGRGKGKYCFFEFEGNSQLLYSVSLRIQRSSFAPSPLCNLCAHPIEESYTSYCNIQDHYIERFLKKGREWDGQKSK